MVDDNDITRLPMYLRARNYGISYLPQEPSVFRKLTVEENILAVLEAQPLDSARAQIASGTADCATEPGTHPQARAAMRCRAASVAAWRLRVRCAFSPTFILLDEPFSGIDPIAVLELQKIIFDLKVERDRNFDHRPQRARDIERDGPRLHHCGRAYFSRRHAARTWKRC